MSTTATTRTPGSGDADTPDRPIGRTRAVLRRPFVIDCGVAMAFLAVAIWVGHGLLPDPATRALSLNPEDQILIEWFLAVDTRVLLADHGLVTDRLNAPDGINLVANATSLTLGFLLAPITLTLGAPASFAVLTVGNLAGTATAWYLLFARTLGARRAAAVAGGALCGFAPAMVSHSNSHWHMTSQWLVPAIVWSVVRMARAAALAGAEAQRIQPAPAPGSEAGAEATDVAPDAGGHRRVFTSAAWLAGLVVVQYFLGAEVLFLTAITLFLVVIGYALARRAWARRVLPGFAAGLAAAIGMATLLLAYPLWVQFAGPGSVPDGPFPADYFSADLLSWPAFSPLTVVGTEATAYLATSAAEYNTFLGWPLLLVGTGCVIWLRDRPLVRAAAAAVVVMGVLSLGPELVVNQDRPGLPLPYRVLDGFPLVEGALPQRFAMAVVPLLATVLVLALDRAIRERAERAERAAPASRTPGRSVARPRAARAPVARWLAPVAIGVALLPLFPTPLPVGDRGPVPEFVSGGHWRGCVRPGGVLVPVPAPTPQQPESMRWAAEANAEFALPEGFFIGPYGKGGKASMGTYKQPTSSLLASVAATGETPEIEPEHREQAARDLAFWEAECVVLDPDQPHEAQLRDVLVALLGPGEQVADAWVWRNPPRAT